ncbi:alcohol dehydrogenase [Pyrenophora seminiperda CCB06]|uniref:Alcohol dehydrogenase n=1 Tax=Pyrenophora seminiperda CCB06 TaxID=1302712 RepID=A0A3M7M372_9PLEO|nr:alcohol dehydrogenase [Pyrenophora seminiperda CCB06]
MREKLKAVLHRRRKSTPTQSPRTSYEKSEESSPRAADTSSRQDTLSSEAHNRVPQTHSANHGEQCNHSPTSQVTSSRDDHSTDTNVTSSIADDYRSYLPAIAAVEASSGDTHVIHGGSDGRHTKDVADKNVHQRRASLKALQSKPLPVIPNTSNLEHDNVRKQATFTGPVSSTVHAIPSQKTAKDNRDDDRSPDWKARQQSMLEGVVDLKNTVDADRDTAWAPAVTHEVIKPHEHEIIQQRLYREIHNYTYYHRLQPVLHTEVLPPRHFIPNPDGEGLIEISAEELPARTGNNRWWEIVQKEPVLPQGAFEWRTEPEIIEAKPYMTAEGFERRETTIIYPPTLEDMSNYRGMVQPVHFDHKTGKRWLGELTTIEKLKQASERVESKDDIHTKEATVGLAETSLSSTVKRKPVGLGSV